MREGRRAVPESLGLGPDRVVGLASFLIRNGACCMMRYTAEIASPQSDGRGHEHEIREPRDAQLRANLARASIGTELLIEARGPAIALAFQTPIAPKGQCRHYRAFSTIVAWIVHGSFSCALVCAVLLNLVFWYSGILVFNVSRWQVCTAAVTPES